MKEEKQDHPAVIFIEYRSSNLPTCTSPLDESMRTPPMLSAIPEELLNTMRIEGSPYTIMYWSEHFINKEKGSRTLKNFAQKRKIEFLMMLKKQSCKFVVFVPRFASTIVYEEFQGPAVKSIYCVRYQLENQNVSKYAISFNCVDPEGEGLFSFYFQEIPLFSPAALMAS